MAKKGRPLGRKPKIEIRGEQQMFDLIDKERGHEPRSAHIRRSIEMSGYVALPQEQHDYAVIYQPHLPRGGLIRFLQELNSSQALYDQRLSGNINDWEHIGYQNRPIPEGSYPMRIVHPDNLIEEDGYMLERSISTHHSHALIPNPNFDGNPAEERMGRILVDRETFLRYGHAYNLRGYVLEPLIQKLYQREYRHSFAVGTLLRFEDRRVWRLEEVNICDDNEQIIFSCRPISIEAV